MGPNAYTGKLVGQKVAVVGRLSPDERATLEATARDEGAELVDGLKTGPDVLVEGFGTGGQPPAAVAKVRKKFPAAQVVAPAEFYCRLLLTDDEFDAILRGPAREPGFWMRAHLRVPEGRHCFDLAGRDFRDLHLRNAFLLTLACLDRCDWSGATLCDVSVGSVRGATFDGATLRGGSFGTHRVLTECRARNLDLEDTDLAGARFERCDFSGARLAARPGTGAHFAGCDLRGADLSGARLMHATFACCDLTGAALRGSDLRRCDFRGSNLSGIDGSGADFGGANFTGADLRGADFRSAMLTGAAFAGALLAGADFTGASVRGAVLVDPETGAGTDPSGATGFANLPPRTPGPQALAFEAAALRTGWAETNAVVDLGAGETVTLSATISARGAGQLANGRFVRSVPRPRVPDPTFVDVSGFAQALTTLSEYWRCGHLRPESVTVAVQRPPASAALVELARSAWCEAFGI